jgi:hypothetical protein
MLLASEGSISHGTMRSQDLIPCFVGVLTEHQHTNASYFQEEWNKMEKQEEYFNDPENPFTYEEEQLHMVSMSMLLNEEIFDAMDELSPRGYYFGAHEGDGSDYGFWPSIQEEDYTIQDSGPLGQKYSVSCNMKHFGEYAHWDTAIKAIKADMEKEMYWPNIWYINDHGNVELIEY